MATEKAAPASELERRKQVKDERINVWPQLSDQERYALSHEPRDEMHVTAQPVQLRYRYGATLPARLRKRSS